MIRRALAVLAAVSLVSGLNAATGTAATPAASRSLTTAYGVLSTEAVAYGTTAARRADVWWDPATPGSRPIVVLVHGGSWFNATRTSLTSTAQKFADAGFVAVNIDYTSGYDARGVDPARIDAAIAVQWAKANSARYGGNGHVGIFGFSAGGHLAVLESAYYGTSEQYGVDAAVSVSGVLDPQRVWRLAQSPAGLDGDPWTSGTAVLAQWQSAYVGCAYYPTWATCGDRIRRFDPATYFAGYKPPVYAIQGDADQSVPPATLAAVDAELTAAGQEHVTELVPGRAHDLALVTGTAPDDAARWSRVVSWLRARVR